MYRSTTTAVTKREVTSRNTRSRAPPRCAVSNRREDAKRAHRNFRVDGFTETEVSNESLSANNAVRVRRAPFERGPPTGPCRCPDADQRCPWLRGQRSQLQSRQRRRHRRAARLQGRTLQQAGPELPDGNR